MWLDRLVGAAHDRVDAGVYDARPDQPLEPLGSLKAAVERSIPAILAEIKPARPTGSFGPTDVPARARAYAEGGACGISVLTDPDHFGGSLANLERARSAHLPLLMKDFLVHETQLEAADAWGASAVLTIARLHTEDRTEARLEALVERAHQMDLEVMTEVVTAEELDLAIEVGSDLVGINTRDLDTLEVDPDRPATLLAGRQLPVPVIHLSGVQGPSDVQRALKAGAAGVLVGTSLMAVEDPTPLVRSLAGVGR